MNYDAITIEDCIAMYIYKNKGVVLNDGKVMSFRDEAADE